MRKRFITTLFALLVVIVCAAKSKPTVWINPAVSSGNLSGDGYFRCNFEIKKVEMTYDYTAIHGRMRYRGDHPKVVFCFSKETCLRANGMKYTATRTEGFELGKWKRTNNNGFCDITLYF